MNTICYVAHNEPVTKAPLVDKKVLKGESTFTRQDLKNLVEHCTQARKERLRSGAPMSWVAVD